MATPPELRLPTDVVRVTVRGFYPDAPKRTKTFWAKPLASKKPGQRVFLKVNAQGEAPVSYNARTNVETTTKEILICTDANVTKIEPAIYSLKYDELETLHDAEES